MNINICVASSCFDPRVFLCPVPPLQEQKINIGKFWLNLYIKDNNQL